MPSTSQSPMRVATGHLIMLVSSPCNACVKTVKTAAARERLEGVRRCSKGLNTARCQCCSILTETPAGVVRSVMVNGRDVKVEDAITCKTESVIYVIMSRRDPTRCYGGQTGGRVDRRLGQHRRDIIEF